MVPKNRRVFWVICLVFLFCFGAAGSAFAAAKEIRYGYLVADQLHNPAVMVMKEKKLLEAAGFNVTWREYLTGAYAMPDMTAGAIDFANCGAVPVMITHAQGMKVAILAGGNQEGSSLVVSDDIKTVKDLDGKKVGTPGTGAIQDAMIAQVAADNNIKIMRVSMKVSDMPLFLQKKEVAGIIAWAPHPARAVANNFGHELLTSHDMMPGHQCCVMAAPAEMLKNDPETVRAVVKVYLEAYQWFLDNQDESIQMMAKATGMSEDIVRVALQTVKYPNPPYCNTESMEFMAKGLIETGKINAITEADLGPFIKDLYRPEMMEELTGTKRPE